MVPIEMKIIARTGLFALAVSLVSLAACSSSDKNAAGGGAGASTAGTGGTSETGGSDATGMGGSSVAGASGTSAAGAAGMAIPGMDGGTVAKTNIKAADGGTITADGLSVKIPPGALMADTDITVAISDGAGLPGAAMLAGKVYDLGPTGTMFLKPVTLTFDYDAAKVVAPKIATVAYLDLAAGAWVALAGSATNGKKAVAATTHFTPYGVVITDPVINACLGMAGAACTTCCETTFASGKDKVIPSIIQTCACDVGALCNAQCTANICAGMAITPECQACIQAETSKSQSDCFDYGLIACQAWSDCKSYEDCALSCM
jgi:ZU5 domain